MDKVIQEMKRGDDNFLLPQRFIEGLTAALTNLPLDIEFDQETSQIKLKRNGAETLAALIAVATQSKSGLMSASDKSKLNNIDEHANNYTHPTTAGNKHIPSGGSSGKFLGYTSSGTASWQDIDAATHLSGILPIANGGTGRKDGLIFTLGSKGISNANLNEIVETGVYEVLPTLQNAPFDGKLRGLLLNLRYSDGLVTEQRLQILSRYMTYQVFIREFYSAVGWTSWYELTYK